MGAATRRFCLTTASVFLGTWRIVLASSMLLLAMLALAARADASSTGRPRRRRAPGRPRRRRAQGRAWQGRARGRSRLEPVPRRGGGGPPTSLLGGPKTPPPFRGPTANRPGGGPLCFSRPFWGRQHLFLFWALRGGPGGNFS